MGPRAAARGNGAVLAPPVGNPPTSMGPRAAARGNGERSCPMSPCLVTSMGPRAAARGNLDTHAHHLQRQTRFNGAASSCSRKPLSAVRAATTAALLQWGREQLLAETSPQVHVGYMRNRASMGPRAAARG